MNSVLLAVEALNPDIETLCDEAIELQDEINAATSDPLELKKLAADAVIYLNDLAQAIYTGDEVRISGTYYVPDKDKNGLPDILSADVQNFSQTTGRSLGFHFMLSTVDLSLGKPTGEVDEENGETSTLEKPSSSYVRLELGHLAVIGHYQASTPLGKVDYDLAAFAPVALSKLERIADIAKYRIDEAGSQLETNVRVQLDTLIGEGAVEASLLVALNDFFKQAVEDGMGSIVLDNCLSYLNTKLSVNGPGVEIISDYICMNPDGMSDVNAYTCDEIVCGSYQELCFGPAYQPVVDRADTFVRSRHSDFLAVALVTRFEDTDEMVVTIPIEGIREFEVINSH